MQTCLIWGMCGELESERVMAGLHLIWKTAVTPLANTDRTLKYQDMRQWDQVSSTLPTFKDYSLAEAADKVYTDIMQETDYTQSYTQMTVGDILCSCDQERCL